MGSVINKGVSFKAIFYNDCVSHPEAYKTLTDERYSYQYYYSRFDQPKNYPAKNKKNIYNRPKKGSGKKSGPAVPPTTALRRMTQVFISHIDLTLPVAMVTENGRHNRLK